MLNQRKHGRISTLLDTLYYSELDDPNFERVYYPGTIINMCKHGIAVRVSRAHRLYSHLMFEGIGNIEKPVSGVVQWISHDEGNYRIGIRFFRGIL